MRYSQCVVLICWARTFFLSELRAVEDTAGAFRCRGGKREADVIEFVGRLGGVGLIEILSNLSNSEEAACAWIKTVLLRLFVGSEALGRSGVSHKSCVGDPSKRRNHSDRSRP